VEVKVKNDIRIGGYRFCCSNRPEGTFVSEGSQLIVMHRSLGALGHGFRARLWAEIDQTLPVLTTTTESPITTTENPDTSNGHGTLPGEILPTFTKPDIENNKIGGEEQTSIEPFTLFPTLFPTLPVISTTQVTTTRKGYKISVVLHNLNCLAEEIECACGPWSDWIGECTQNCGGCGRRVRKRACRDDTCRKEDKRPCNMQVCPPNVNFLINNGEFHLVINGCCIGLYASGNECGGLDAVDNPLLSLFYKILHPEDAQNRTRQIPVPD
jgi:hypothetical protein